MRELHGDTMTKKSHISRCEALARLLKHYGSFSTFNRYVLRDSFASYGGIAFLERPSSSLHLPYPGDSLVLIDFTIMYCPVANQPMQHPGLDAH